MKVLKKLRGTSLILFISMLFFTTGLFAEVKAYGMYNPSENNNKEILESKDDIYLESTNEVAKVSDLYIVDGIGEYADYKIIKGYPNENEFRVYYKGDGNSYSFIIEDLRKINLDEIITWKYGNILFKSTKRDLYRFFSNTSEFSSSLGISSKVLSHEWFIETFKDTYSEWSKKIAYYNDAQRLIEEYFKKTGQIKIDNNITLTPDAKFKVETGWEEYNGFKAFCIYDKNGKLLGKYTDEDDTNLVMAKYEKRQEMPPKLSEGWISTNLLKKIYDFDIRVENNDIIFETDPAVINYKEFLRLKLPNGWMKDENKEAKANGIKIKKYIIPDNRFTKTWIDSETLYKEFDIQCTIGDTIEEFQFYAPYNMKTYVRPKLFKGQWPTNWQDSDNQKEVNIDGLRVKRENDINYFNFEDLKKLNIVPKPKQSLMIYLNIADLQKIGLIN